MRCVRLFFPSLEYESSHTTSAAAALMLSLDLVASFSLSALLLVSPVSNFEELRRGRKSDDDYYESQCIKVQS